MEKDCCQINITKKEDGFTVDVTGKNIEDMCGCMQNKFACCSDSPDGSKKDADKDAK